LLIDYEKWMPRSPNSQPPIKAPDNTDDDVANEAEAAAMHKYAASQPATAPITRKAASDGPPSPYDIRTGLRRCH
jgi:hypothetical protein